MLSAKMVALNFYAMEKILIITQVVISILLVLIILIQNKDGGLSAVMGGGGSFHATKRGAEKVIAHLTVLLAFLFVMNALLFVFV